jgi:hypothetical protein
MAVKRYDGSAWQTVAGLGAQGPAATSSSIATWVKTASGGETSVSGNDDNSQPLSYTIGQELVFINGVLQKRGADYTANTGNSITGLSALTANDIVSVWTVNAFSVANTYTQAQVDAAFVNNTNYWAAGKNYILNSDFNIWQRGTSIANSSAAANYTADRWFIYSGTANKTVSRQTTSDTTNLPFIQYCARVQRNSGNTALDSIIYAQSLETVASIPFVGKTVTLSFYARKGANFSSSSDILNMALNTGTGTDQNNVTSFTGFATPLSQNVTLTSTWQRFSASVSIATTVTQIGIRFTYTPTGTAGANDYFEVTGVQLEAGSTATAFQTATGTIAGELAACQRYYWRRTGFQIAGGTQSAFDNTMWFPINTFNAVPMRATPTAAIESSPYITDFQTNNRTITSVTVSSSQLIGLVYDSTKLSSNTSYGANFNDSGRALSFSSEL